LSDLLYVVGSPRKEKSESSAIADAYVAEFRDARLNAVVDVLDLWSEGLPAFDGDRAAAKMTVFSGQQLEGAEASAWEAVTARVREILSSYFTDWLEFIGVTDIEETRFQPRVLTAAPDEARQAAHQRARDLANSTLVSRVT